ncbi:MAG TPA: hydroxyacid dehydrogenase [Vicinamibacteria bacterium]
MPAPARPRLVVLAPAALFRSFFDAAARKRLRRSFRWNRIAGRTIKGRVRAALRDADALVTTWDSPHFGDDLLGQAPRLRVIGHCGGEVKGRFPEPLFSRLTITNAPAPMARPVAELAVTLLLYAARNVDGYRQVLRSRSNAIYARLHRDGAGPETLHGRTVGLLGFGQIGRGIAAMLAPFGPRLLVHDPYVASREIRRAGGTPASWRQVLTRAQDLVLAAALTDRTRGLVDASALARLPDGATVINVARGGLVDLPALTREVRSGRLRCALDVTDPEEPLPPRHPLRRARGAILTPHVGAAQREVRRAMARLVLDDLERFFRGRPVRNRVSASRLRRMT